jgi:hypothetical protein
MTQVATGLADRGFERTLIDPELRVYFQLVVREQLVQQNVTSAIQHLASLHDAPSYDVQTTKTEIRRYEIAELLVLMIDSRERRLVWRGRLNERYLDAFTPHLGEAVSLLLAHLPSPRLATDSRTVIVKEGAR